ncbi:LysM peptidoglycan-binding domain-containing protein [Saccharopolyspora phatthalungensis]|uniref:DNA-binding SARP family transcriptional activator/nucleoid-associated protein YgaU n=1 Tax=Saccharopolyspora phatthalungensis TaxID=664693 RepID=A0A840QB95_9PSEU|nr:LysM peptidoglycan-binding domain-containing protein [Saccharopolyspora phatthalungensis]MBB5155918.1 DNA-binding SARP family transcriptional activator/nucleoid-associated protein YgaU [Saccharopolyspora phatthalungensis]
MNTSSTRHRQRRRSGTRHPVWRAAVATARIVGRVLQGVLASTVLGALLAGLPWALWHYIGWPLPDHLPDWVEVQAVLLGPMTTTFLLDVLACLCWITWAAFVIDVAHCTLAALQGLRWPELHAGGPVHAVAAILIGVLVASLLGNRSLTAAATGMPEGTSGSSAVVATAPTWNTAVPRIQPITTAGRTPSAAAIVHRSAEIPASTVETVIVRAPEGGIHDSLSRIAARTLGDGIRWPEIFELNKGKLQPGGGRFTNPNLIFPGEELALPPTTTPETSPPRSGDQDGTASTLPVPPPPPPTSTPPSPSSTPVPSTSPSPPSSEQHAPPASPAAPDLPTDARPRRDPGIAWGPEVFVGLGLAAAVSAALVMARRRSRRTYQPGSGRRDDDLPVAPVVYQLRLAHLRAEHDDTDGNRDPDESGNHGRRGAARPLVVGAPAPSTDPSSVHATVDTAAGIGVRDGRDIALDLASAQGLGLLGAGAPAAARALLLAMLATEHPPAGRAPRQVRSGATVIVPAGDLALLLGPEATRSELPTTLRVVADLDTALDELEAEILRRTRENEPSRQQAWPVVALVARPPDQNTQRLQAVLDNGAPLGVVAILLGQWRPGVTTYIRADGTVTATSPGPGEALRGTRVFRLPEAATTDLLDLLRQAQPDTPPSTADGPENARASSNTAAAVGNPNTPETTTTGYEVPDNTELEVTAISDAEQPDITRARPVTDPAWHSETTTSPPDRSSGDQHPNRAHVHAETTSPAGHVAEEPEREPGLDDRPVTPIALTVLGSPHVRWRHDPRDENSSARDVTSAFPPRQRELLVFLAVHPDGVHRDALVTALWEDNPPERPTNALNTALSRLRRCVREATDGALSDITIIGESRYQLDPALVDVDYWHFHTAVAARRAAATDDERIIAYQRIVTNYGGKLADGMDTEWIDAAREAARRDAIDAVAALARAHVNTDPEYTLDLLETAREFDPHNELLYRDIMRLQERLDRHDAIPRTLALLSARMAEVGDKPTAQALDLAARLQHRTDPPPSEGHRRQEGEHRRGTAAAS